MFQVRRRREQFSPVKQPFIEDIDPDTFSMSEAPCTVTGKRFGDTQGTSTLTIADNADLDEATIKRNCTIIKWTDTEIWACLPSIDDLPETSFMFVVTDRGTSNAYPVTIMPL